MPLEKATPYSADTVVADVNRFITRLPTHTNRLISIVSMLFYVVTLRFVSKNGKNRDKKGNCSLCYGAVKTLMGGDLQFTGCRN